MPKLDTVLRSQRGQTTAEYALVTASRPRLQERAAAGSRGAKRALALMATPVIFIGTVQVAITVFSIAMGAIGQPLLTDYFEAPLSHGIAYTLVPTLVRGLDYYTRTTWEFVGLEGGAQSALSGGGRPARRRAAP